MMCKRGKGPKFGVHKRHWPGINMLGNLEITSKTAKAPIPMRMAARMWVLSKMMWKLGKVLKPGALAAHLPVIYTLAILKMANRRGKGPLPMLMAVNTSALSKTGCRTVKEPLSGVLKQSCLGTNMSEILRITNELDKGLTPIPMEPCTSEISRMISKLGKAPKHGLMGSNTLGLLRRTNKTAKVH